MQASGVAWRGPRRRRPGDGSSASSTVRARSLSPPRSPSSGVGARSPITPSPRVCQEGSTAKRNPNPGRRASSHGSGGQPCLTRRNSRSSQAGSRAAGCSSTPFHARDDCWGAGSVSSAGRGPSRSPAGPGSSTATRSTLVRPGAAVRHGCAGTVAARRAQGPGTSDPTCGRARRERGAGRRRLLRADRGAGSLRRDRPVEAHGRGRVRAGDDRLASRLCPRRVAGPARAAGPLGGRSEEWDRRSGRTSAGRGAPCRGPPLIVVGAGVQFSRVSRVRVRGGRPRAFRWPPPAGRR